jgi:hypothetical protein
MSKNTIREDKTCLNFNTKKDYFNTYKNKYFFVYHCISFFGVLFFYLNTLIK